MNATVIEERGEGARVAATDAQTALVIDMLDFYSTDPRAPEAKQVSDLMTDSRFAGYSKTFLREMTASLRNAGALFKLPQRGTRDSAYLTTKAGVELRKQLQE